jgi:glutamyl-tRNA reductase
VAKRIRRETGIGRLGVSVSSVAIQFVMRQQRTPVRDQMVILIGAGEMAEQAAQALFKSGVGEVLVTNRTYQRSVEVARQIGGKAFRFEDLPRLLPEVDIIIASTSAPHYLLTRQSLAAILPARSKPLFIIDISVPRCIDPEIEGLDSVFFADIDRLQELGAQNLKTRMEEAKKAEEIIQKETRKFSNWLKERKVAPLISALHGQAEQIRKQELARTLSRTGNGNGVDPEVLDRVTRAVVKRILVTPTRRLRQEAVDEARSHHIQNLFRVLFEIDPTPGKKPE